MNYKNIVPQVAADPFGVDADTWLEIEGDRFMSQAVWAQAKDGSINPEITIRKIESLITRRDIHRHSEFDGCVFRTLRDITAVPDRYLPYKDTPIIGDDLGAVLSDIQLAIVHCIFKGVGQLAPVANFSDAELWGVVDDIANERNSRYGRIPRFVEETWDSPTWAALYVLMIHTPSSNSDLLSNVSEERTELKDQMKRLLGISDIQEICFLLGVDFEEIEGDNKTLTILNLIRHFENQGKIDDLVSVFHGMRPNAKGSGAIAIGKGSIAVGSGGVYIGGNVLGSINTGSGNKNIRRNK